METLVKERKSYLQKENEILTEHLNTYMGKVEHLLQENRFLQKEAKRNQEESKAYLSYLTKHLQQYPGLLTTLNDQNHTDLSHVSQQKKELISEYTEKEKEVRSSLVNVETEYSLLNKEVEDLQASQEQLEQTKKIKELEKELLVTKIHHSDETRNIKSSFLKAKADCKRDIHRKIQVLSKRAEAEAKQSLIQHIKQVKAENERLHQELLRLIQYSKVLKETQVQLRDQQQQLLWENQYTQDMAYVRHWLHQHQAQMQMEQPAGFRAASGVSTNLTPPSPLLTHTSDSAGVAGLSTAAALGQVRSKEQ